MGSFCPITVAAALNIVADVVESLLCVEGGSINSQPDFGYAALTADLYEADIQQNLGRMKYLLQRRQANHPLYSLMSDSAHALESDAISRCLCLMEDVVAIGTDRATEKAANGFGEKGVELYGSLETLCNDVGQLSSSPNQSDERLKLSGGQVAEAFVDARGATIHFTRWIRALLLAVNAYSVG